MAKNPFTNNTKAQVVWSKSEAATLLYMMDHVCSPQDSLKASFDVLDNKDLFSEHAYNEEVSESVIKDDKSVKEFEKVIPFLREVIAQFLAFMNSNDNELTPNKYCSINLHFLVYDGVQRYAFVLRMEYEL
jgi:hypothetical protein